MTCGTSDPSFTVLNHFQVHFAHFAVCTQHANTHSSACMRAVHAWHMHAYAPCKAAPSWVCVCVRVCGVPTRHATAGHPDKMLGAVGMFAATVAAAQIVGECLECVGRRMRVAFNSGTHRVASATDTFISASVLVHTLARSVFLYATGMSACGHVAFPRIKGHLGSAYIVLGGRCVQSVRIYAHTNVYVLRSSFLFSYVLSALVKFR